MPATTPRTVREAKTLVLQIDKSRRDLHDDPMTAAYGCPVADFYEEYDRRERALLTFIYKRTRLGSRLNRWAMDRLEAYMP